MTSTDSYVNYLECSRHPAGTNQIGCPRGGVGAPGAHPFLAWGPVCLPDEFIHLGHYSFEGLQRLHG